MVEQPGCTVSSETWTNHTVFALCTDHHAVFVMLVAFSMGCG